MKTDTIFKLKVKAYKAGFENEFEKLQEGLRPDCILYTGPASIYHSDYGISNKKYNKALDKRFGNTSVIEDWMHIIIYVKFNSHHFETTHALGTPDQHTVFHDRIFIDSLNNYKEYLKSKEWKSLLNELHKRTLEKDIQTGGL